MRKKRAGSRIRIPDPRYNDVLVSEFINNIMTAGKKHQARRILYDAFTIIEERTKQPGLDVFRKAMSNARPVLEVRPAGLAGRRTRCRPKCGPRAVSPWPYAG